MTSETPILRADGLGRRYGSEWALRDISTTVRPGAVTALVGPNGAGKTTLLHLAVGLNRPTTGRIELFGRDPIAERRDVLPQVGFVGQEHPLHRDFTLAETLELGRRLNDTWDGDLAPRRLRGLGLEPKRKVRELSGGQQAQVALTLALAKRPRLLLLDEPAAALDPLARREFLGSVMEAVAETGLTVLFSSHYLADLERVCDHVLVLANARVVLDGAVDDILAGHRFLSGPRADAAGVARHHEVVHARHTPRQTTLLVRSSRHVHAGEWRVEETNLEEILLAYLDRDRGGGGYDTSAADDDEAHAAVAR